MKSIKSLFVSWALFHHFKLFIRLRHHQWSKNLKLTKRRKYLAFYKRWRWSDSWRVACEVCGCLIHSDGGSAFCHHLKCNIHHCWLHLHLDNLTLLFDSCFIQDPCPVDTTCILTCHLHKKQKYSKATVDENIIRSEVSVSTCLAENFWERAYSGATFEITVICGT